MNQVQCPESMPLESDPELLLEEYRRTGSIALRNELVLHYSPIVRRIALQMRGIFSSYAQQEDIVNEGILTLIDCLERYDSSKGAKFETYAFLRVRGAVIDFVRKQDWIPRRVHGNAKQISAAHDSLCHELLREPTPQEVAKRMGISVDTLSRYTSEISNSVMFSFEELIQNTAQMGDALEDSMGSAPGPEENVYRKEQKQVLMEAIDSLNERERLVVSLYYYERLRLADIASVLGVSEQRVSQINSRAVAKLRVPLEKYRKG